MKVDKRIDWVDMLKGFAMLTVVYCHNFPAINTYIYSFHMPLFFLLAGLFHKQSTKLTLKKNSFNRFKTIVIPYYIWGSILYAFWFFIGRSYGDSVSKNLSVTENFIGLLSGQGGEAYMDWGIPLWFLPCVFVTFILFSVIDLLHKKTLKLIIILCLAVLGYVIKNLLPWYFWSIDVALVALVFYGIGSLFKDRILNIDISSYYIFIPLLLYLVGMRYNGTIDMYRSQYGGNLIIFCSNAFSAILIFILVFSKLPKIKPLVFIGKNTIVYLATQLRVLTFIKAILLFGLGISVFNFTEFHKIIITIVQSILIVPIVYFVNAFIPILNGKIKVKS